MSVATYQNNISMELVVLVFMLLLLFFNLVFRTDRIFTKAVNYLQICVILLMLVQILQWYIMDKLVTGNGTALLQTIQNTLYCIDYFLVCQFSVVFYYYLVDYIGYWRRKQGDTRSFPERDLRFLISFGLILTVAYSIGAATDSLTIIRANGRIGGTLLYHSLLVGAELINVYNLSVILRNRKVLSYVDTLLLITHVLVPLPLIVIDLIRGTCLGYLGMALSVVIVFLGIDIQQAEHYLEQEALISHQKEVLSLQKTQIMLTQIQPHFLYNTLGTISYFCRKDPRQAEKMIQYFSRYLRTNMDSIESEELIPFEKEWEHVQCYLWIEQIRYADRLRLEYDIQCTDFFLPPLSVQPLVENAVKHGVRSRDEGGTVTISTRREGNRVFISVSDTGTGFDPEQVKKDGKPHIGLKNIAYRLETLCDAELTVESGENGTKITICIEEKRV